MKKKEEKRSNGNLRFKIGITFIFAILGFTEVTNGQQKPVIQNSIDAHQWIEEHFSEGVAPLSHLFTMEKIRIILLKTGNSRLIN